MGNRGRGEGGGRVEEKRVGGVQEAGVGFPLWRGAGEIAEKLRNIAQYFVIQKVQRCWRQQKSVGTALKCIESVAEILKCNHSIDSF